MPELEQVVPLIINNRHVNDIHIQVIDQLIQQPKTYKQLSEKVTKNNGKPYSKSYIRKTLTQLQYNDIISKEFVTSKHPFYVINHWRTFKNTWNKRRKRIKRNIFNKASRELPTKKELKEKENKDDQ